MKMKYTGFIPVLLYGHGEVKPGETHDIEDRLAEGLLSDENWQKVEKPLKTDKKKEGE